MWRLPALVGALAAVTFAVGFVFALRGSLGERMGDVPPPSAVKTAPIKKTGHRFLLVLGDSISRGTGDEGGKGYAADVADSLRKRGATDLANLAVNGAESADVLDVLKSPNTARLVSAADWIVFSAGGNDLSHSIPRIASSAGAPLDAIAASRSAYVANLREILTRIREANPSAPVYVIGLYDPFGNVGPQGRVGSSVVRTWNALLEETALSFPNVTVVPTFDLFYGRPDRLAADHFHPNAAGHQAIADRVVQLIR
ncbi:MAG TPA: GDSL-type esterase/lipase family protein [Thermoanaerobaculia bacterium]|nr:GDSL-type esterase/lipase family protein [Thermoanaerobaculia bacterium]